MSREQKRADLLSILADGDKREMLLANRSLCQRLEDDPDTCDLMASEPEPDQLDELHAIATATASRPTATVHHRFRIPELPTHTVDGNGLLVPVKPSTRKPKAVKPKAVKPRPTATASRIVTYSAGSVGKITYGKRDSSGEPFEHPTKNVLTIAVERYEPSTGRIVQRFFIGRQEAITLSSLPTDQLGKLPTK